jgi:16S rRNA processing protein RimM
MSRISLYTKEGNLIRTLTIRNIRILESKGYLLIDTDEIDDRDKADALRGTVVMIPSSERYSLSSGEYWVDEIIGLDVVNSLNGEVIGKVVNIIDVGENDLYQILTSTEEERFIPAVSQFISRIDVAEGRIYVNVIEGLLD